MRFPGRRPLDAATAERHHFRMPSLRSLAAGLALALLAPVGASAQLLPPGVGPGGPAFNPIAGARLGWSIRDSSPALGGQLRLALPIPLLRPAVTVGGDVVFQTGLRELQGWADVTTGLLRPLYIGGGPAVLNSVFEDSLERQTKTGYTLVAGIGGGRTGPLVTGFEFRWVRVGGLSPRFLVLTLGYPLLGGS
jgi:hypothetical protein